MLSAPKQIVLYFLISATSSSSMLNIRSTAYLAAVAFSPRTLFATKSVQKAATVRSMTAKAAASTPLTLEEHSSSYKSLIEKLQTITHLNHASSVLNYDRQVFMTQSGEYGQLLEHVIFTMLYLHLILLSLQHELWTPPNMFFNIL